MDDHPSISIVVPIHNEVENIPILYRELVQVLEEMGRDFEIIWVDDGSSDGSLTVLTELANEDGRNVVIEFRRNFGQTAAMQAGIDASSGKWVVTLDGDLQNDPRDIPEMVRVAEAERVDVVHGWRKQRRDKWLTRRLPSLIANRLISRVTRFPIHDLGCTLKVIDRAIAGELELYGEMHRFIPILAHWRGARCKEVVTHHRPRRFGETKYGLSRTIRVLLDLVTVHFMLRYSARPMQWFGLLGMASGMLAGVALLAVLAMKLAWGTDMTGNPLLLVTVLATMLAVQFVSLGILGETTARIFFRTRGLAPYAIRSVRNLSDGAERRLDAKAAGRSSASAGRRLVESSRRAA